MRYFYNDVFFSLSTTFRVEGTLSILKSVPLILIGIVSGVTLVQVFFLISPTFSVKPQKTNIRNFDEIIGEIFET